MIWAALLFLVLTLLLLMMGYPVAFTLGGVSVLVGIYFLGFDFMALLPMRIFGIMTNKVLMAVPLFVFMGLTLQKSGIAERMLLIMSASFGRVRGGLAFSVILVGAMLAASTGIVGATVVTMGLISLPVFLRQQYDPSVSCGIIAASGTLGQVIPPSIVLILLGSVLNISVGSLFVAALMPSLVLVGFYILYILALGWLAPRHLGGEDQRDKTTHYTTKDVLVSFLLPFMLVAMVLGSIFLGIASPTESAALGAAGALLLAFVGKKMDWTSVRKVSEETTHLTSMVFFILLGATTFSLVFRGLGGDDAISEILNSMSLTPNIFLLIVLLAVFALGFFLDFIEIIFIIIPILLPIFQELDFNLVWVGILIAMNLQTSFLTPPFGFSLFYLKGVAPDSIQTSHIYRGVLPFIVIQWLVMTALLIFPEWFFLSKYV